MAISLMRKAGMTVLCGLALCVSGMAEEAGAPPAAERIPALIKQLGDAEFDTREAAKQQLRDLGEDAREALERAQKGSDPEVSHAAAVLLHAINRATIRIKVADAQDQPLDDVTVTLSLNPMQANLIGIARGRQLTASTGKDGVAVFSDLDPMHYNLQITCTPPGYLRVYKSVQQPVKTGVNEFKLACSRGAQIHGVLLSADGKPLAGVRVAAVQSGYLKHLLARQRDLPRYLANMPNVQTGEDGRFELKTLAESDYGVVAYNDDKVLLTHTGVSARGEETVDLKELKTETKSEDAAEQDKPEEKTEAAEKTE